MINKPLLDSLEQVEKILEIIDQLDSKKKQLFYIDNNVGSHIRHILDHVMVLKIGIRSGILDYNKRNRNSIIERDPSLATKKLNELQYYFTGIHDMEGGVRIISEVDFYNKVSVKIFSNIEREVLYIINHTIHHVAHIKLIGKYLNIEMPDYIGIAPATTSYNRTNDN